MTATNVYFYNTYANKRVTIGSANVEYNFTNNLVSEPLKVPVTTATNTNTTKISNMLRIIERFSVTGNISTNLNPQVSSPVERTNAKDVMTDLITIGNIRAKKSDTTTWSKMVYDGTTYNVTFEKINIREFATDLGGEAPSGVMRYEVTITVVVGDPLF